MKTILIDGHSVAFRAFFALGDLKTKEGFPTSVIHGFTMMLKKTIEDYKPDNLIVAWDISRKTFRTDLYSEYKANRKSSPNSFKTQIPELKKLLDSFNIVQASQENYEADDVLGSLAKQISSKDNMVYILTGDRDSFQLIDKYINVIYTKKGISETEIVNEKAFSDKYGIKVNQYIDYLALKGDASDNIPGVPGIGKITALNLLKQYSSIEGILRNLDELKPKQKENLETFRDQINLSRELATIVTDLNIKIDEAPVNQTIFWNEDLIKPNIKILEKYELNTFLKGISKEANNIEMDDIGNTNHINKESWIGIERDKILVYQEKNIYLYSGTREDFIAQLDKLNNNFYVVSADKYYKIATNKDYDVPIPKFSLDIGTYILNSNSKPDSYEKIAKYYKLNSYKNIKNEKYDPNLIEILGNIDKILPNITKQFKSGEYSKIYENIDSPVMPILARMTYDGISIDKKKINILSKLVSEDISKLKSKIFSECSSEFNLNSPKQLSEVLYTQLDLPVIKKTPKGAPSTDASVLEELSKKHKIAEYLLEYREIEKLRSTYIDGLSTDIVKGKIHSTFNLFGTTTGRLSSEKPNLQNIPSKTELGRKIREFFISSEGKTFIIADYSQIELRVLAHMSSDNSMKKILCDRNKDIHIETASRIFKTKNEDITYDMRRKAKEINFGLLYGMEAFGLAKNLGVSRKEATELIDSYFVQFPNVQKYLAEIVLSSKEKGYTETVYGRRRYIAELQSENNQIYSIGKRMAMNAPIQGTAADIVKIAMIAIEKVISSDFKGAKILLQVHDEIVVECIDKDSTKVQDVVIQCMESVKGISVPLYVNSSISLDLANKNK